RARCGNYGCCRRADCEHAIVPALHRLRLRHHHVCGRGAGRHGQHPRRLLGRTHHRAGAADVDPGAALPAAEHGDLPGLPPHHFLPAPGDVRTRLGAHLMAAPASRPTLRSSYLAIGIFAGLYLALGLMVRNSYYQLIMTLVLVWASMGLSWNMLSGYSGLISFGHAAFFGLGGYTMTIAFVKFGLTPWLGIPLGMAVGVLAGAI